jgi:hypothetical protein
MMAPLIVDPPYRCAPDPSCEARAYCFRSHRVSLVAQNEQISQARQPIRIKRVDELELALSRRLAAGRLAGRSLEVLTVTRRKPADNEGRERGPIYGAASRRRGRLHCRPAERSDLFGDRAERRPRNEAAQRVSDDGVLFGGEELRGADQRLGAFVDPRAEVSERQGG